MATEIIARRDAMAQGLKRYFTGKPCVHGHIAVRQVSSGSCFECMKAQMRAWRARHPDKQVELNRFRYERNGDRIRAQSAAWYAANKERGAASRKAWNKANPDKIRAYCTGKNQRRRARNVAAPGTHSPEDLAEIFSAQGGRCAYCSANLRKSKRHIDHIVPLAAGGSNARSNLQFACSRCNLSKGAKDPISYARSIGLLL